MFFWRVQIMYSSLIKIAFGVILFGITIAGFFFFKKQSPSPPPTPHSLAKTFEWLTQENDWFNVSRPLKAIDLQGRVLIVDFWTAGCINCQHVIPELASLEEEFKDSITIIGVHSGKFLSEHVDQTIKDAIARYDIKHPIVNDKNFVIWKSFGVHSWPTLLVIDPEGKIYRQYSGEKHHNDIALDVQALLKRYPHTVTTPLPISLEQAHIKQSMLLFPGKICYADNFDGEPALFISDSGHHRIVIARLDGRIVQTIGSGKAGFADGAFEQAQFNWPQGVLWDQASNTLYIADTKNHMLRKIDFTTNTVMRLAGTGLRGNHHVSTQDDPRKVALASPWDLAFFPNSSIIAIAQAGTHQIWLYELDKKRLRILAGNGREGIDDGQLPYNTLAQPSGLAVHGDELYFVDAESSALRLFKNRAVQTLVGTGLFDFGFIDGERNHAQLQHPQGLTIDNKGIYIADTYNHAVRFYNFATEELSTLIGNGEAGNTLGRFEESQFNEPNGLVKIGNQLYIVDTNNHRIVIADLEKKRCSVFLVTKSIEH